MGRKGETLKAEGERPPSPPQRWPEASRSPFPRRGEGAGGEWGETSTRTAAAEQGERHKGV